MPELIFKGKEFVFNHHLTVPYRPLLPDAEKSVGEVDLNGNLIVHGDNLHALKALLPQYAGRVDCIIIDPPYNTGNEGWCYNDNVNSPIMKEWLSNNPVNKEDMLRHDKWLAMMWPRLHLLRELLSENGSFWMTIDDTEFSRAREMLDEIFGEDNFVTTVCWQKRYSPSSDAVDFSSLHDYIICYGNNRTSPVTHKPISILNRLERTEEQNKLYKNPDKDPRGLWRTDNYLCNKTAEQRPNLYYAITNPKTGEEIWPNKASVWRYSKARHEKNVRENRVWWGENGENTTPAYKRFLAEVKGVINGTWWDYRESGHNDEAKKLIREIFSEDSTPFDTPKPVRLIKRILSLATDEQSLVLDSFAGSGTTAHAALELNAEDGGERRFILIEGEPYADKLTAERVRRVMNGYPCVSTSKKELLRERITWTRFKKSQDIMQKITGLEMLYGGKFDRINKEIKDGELIVSGETDVAENMPALGGSFTYCTMGEPFNMDALLNGENLPDYTALGGWVFHTATGEALPEGQAVPTDFYLGESSAYHVWLIYKPELDFLKSGDSALTLSRAEKISKSKTDGKKHLVFAPAKFVPNKALLDKRVEFAQLPYALYRREQA